MEESASSSVLALAFAAVCAVVVALVRSVLKRRRVDAVAPDTSDQAKAAISAAAATPPKPTLQILFGSQTGTAEQFAKTLRDEAKREGFAPTVVDLEDFEPDELCGAERAVFLMATYGEGEPTDNAHGFVRWAKQSAKAVEDEPNGELLVLQKTRFAVFGLGNTQYEHFNAMGKLTDELLTKLGATRLVDLGLGDDDKDLEADFDAWREIFWQALRADVGGPESKNGNADEKDDALAFDVAFEGAGPAFAEAAAKETSDAKGAPASTKFYWTAASVAVSLTRELRAPEDGGSTRHVELAAPSASSGLLSWETADNLAVLPENDADDVAAALKALDLSAFKAKRFALVVSSQTAASSSSEPPPKPPFPTPCTVEVALRRYCDLSARPKRGAALALAELLEDDTLKAASADKDAFEAFQTGNPRATASLADLLRWLADESPTRRPKKKRTASALEDDDENAGVAAAANKSRRLAAFLERVAPRLQPRYYTLASSTAADPKSLHVTCAVVDVGGGRKGVCSGYLAGLRPGDRCRAFVRPSTFRMPSAVKNSASLCPGPVPLVLVGPGTGVAPMRAVLRERASALEAVSAHADAPFGPKRVSRAALYFGCKKPDLDHIYADEMAAWKAAGVVEKLEVAFSRTQAHKVYVQDLLKRDAAYVKQALWDDHGVLFVCGGTAMGRSVQDTLLEIFASFAGPEHATNGDAKHLAEAEIQRMKDQGRYVQELWA